MIDQYLVSELGPGCLVDHGTSKYLVEHILKKEVLICYRNLYADKKLGHYSKKLDDYSAQLDDLLVRIADHRSATDELDKKLKWTKLVEKVLAALHDRFDQARRVLDSLSKDFSEQYDEYSATARHVRDQIKYFARLNNYSDIINYCNKISRGEVEILGVLNSYKKLDVCRAILSSGYMRFYCPPAALAKYQAGPSYCSKKMMFFAPGSCPTMSDECYKRLCDEHQVINRSAELLDADSSVINYWITLRRDVRECDSYTSELLSKMHMLDIRLEELSYNICHLRTRIAKTERSKETFSDNTQGISDPDEHLQCLHSKMTKLETEVQQVNSDKMSLDGRRRARMAAMYKLYHNFNAIISDLKAIDRRRSELDSRFEGGQNYTYQASLLAAI